MTSSAAGRPLQRAAVVLGGLGASATCAGAAHAASPTGLVRDGAAVTMGLGTPGLGLIMTAALVVDVAMAALDWTRHYRQVTRERRATAMARMVMLERQWLLSHYAHDVIVVADRSGRIVDVNQRAEQLYGWTREDLLRMSVVGLRAAEMRHTLGTDWNAMVEQDGAIYETVHRRKDGTLVPVEVSGRAIACDGVQLRYEIVRNISARRQAEDQQRRGTELVAAAFVGSADAAITTDLDGQVVGMNPVAEHWTGWSLREAAGRSLLEIIDLIHERTQEPAESPVEQALRSGEPVELGEGWALRSPGGATLPVVVRCAPARDSHGQVIGAVLVCHDGSAQRAEQRALKQQAGLLENLNDAVIATDQEYRIVAWNQAAERLFGWTAQEMLGRSFAEWSNHECPVELISLSREQASSAIRETGRFRGEVRRQHKHGAMVDLELTRILLRHDDGSAAGILEINHARSDRSAAQDQMIRLDREAWATTVAAWIAPEGLARRDGRRVGRDALRRALSTRSHLGPLRDR